MELQGRVTIPASAEQVWQALNDPEILRRCIPGCEEVQQISPEEMHARVLLRMGPVRARFAGKVKMTDIRPLQGYTLNFEGSGGSAGFARGSSVITLTTVGNDTQLDYTAQATVAGKLGQIGGRLIDASSKQLADKFFAGLKATLAGTGSQAEVEQSSAVVSPLASSHSIAIQGHSNGGEFTRLVWFFAGVAATSIGVWMGAHWLR
ncbi:MAG: carbon monoxide dehydrogenase subunit G [Vitreoscilla sp.]|nr:carbon monoxide dehydrogenase subunit G [Polaromonas sp.]